MSVLALADKPYDVQIAAIERGLPVSTLRQIVEALGLSQKAVVEALGFAPRTVALRVSRKQAFSSVESERLFRVIRMRKLARDVFATDEAVAQWLMTPDRTLAGRTPLAMLATDLGTAKVERLLLAMIHGVPV
jgi:putative toxin-antitoxin system antitoxin component (TIGR02293 family)